MYKKKTQLLLFCLLSAVVTTLAVANTVNVYRISKQKGVSGVAFSDDPVVDFPLVRFLVQ